MITSTALPSMVATAPVPISNVALVIDTPSFAGDVSVSGGSATLTSRDDVATLVCPPALVSVIDTVQLPGGSTILPPPHAPVVASAVNVNVFVVGLGPPDVAVTVTLSPAPAVPPTG